MASPSADPTLRRHAEYYLGLSEQGERHLRGPGHGEWLDRLEHEHDNLRAALRWADEHVEVDLLLRLCGALAGFWKGHAHFTEGRRWLERALSLSLGQRTALRAELLEGAGWMSRARGDYESADRLYREALGIRRELGNMDDVATALRLLGNIRYELEDRAEGEMLWRESLDARPPDGDRRAAAETLNNLGVAARDRHDLEAAADYYYRALAIFTEVGDDEGVARIDMNLGDLSYDREDWDNGIAHSQAALARFHAMGNTWDLVDCLDFLGANLAGLGRADEATRIFGASQALREAIGAARSTRDEGIHDGFIARARAQLAADDYDNAWFEGRTMTLDETIEYALAIA
jgi:tetratricopeptide (TPR) repeat protein